MSTILKDHLGGFSKTLYNNILFNLNELHKDSPEDVRLRYITDSKLQKIYKNLNFYFDIEKLTHLFSHFANYNIHPTINYKNFLCSFNGSDHVSRKLLVSVIEKFRWFDPTYCSKNFSYSTDVLDGHIIDYVSNLNNFYRKFFISNNSGKFFQTVNSFGHVQYDHTSNIYNLEHRLTQSFLHIVSESMATSYYPFVTEKFLYSIVTRGLFLAYAQPGWHAHVETYYGFKKYSKLFDYRFDSIQNPVERLVELMTMISKFSVLSADDWRDLYDMESDIIEHNYDHYFSGDYLKHLKTYG